MRKYILKYRGGTTLKKDKNKLDSKSKQRQDNTNKLVTGSLVKKITRTHTLTKNIMDCTNALTFDKKT